jgi:hypothetical protein
LDEIQNFVLSLEQQIVKAQEDARPVGEGALAPGGLRQPRTLHSEFDIRYGTRRNGSDGGTCVWCANRNRFMPAVVQSNLRLQAVEQCGRWGDQP